MSSTVGCSLRFLNSSPLQFSGLCPRFGAALACSVSSARTSRAENGSSSCYGLSTKACSRLDPSLLSWCSLLPHNPAHWVDQTILWVQLGAKNYGNKKTEYWLATTFLNFGNNKLVATKLELEGMEKKWLRNRTHVFPIHVSFTLTNIQQTNQMKWDVESTLYSPIVAIFVLEAHTNMKKPILIINKS